MLQVKLPSCVVSSCYQLHWDSRYKVKQTKKGKFQCRRPMFDVKAKKKKIKRVKLFSRCQTNLDAGLNFPINIRRPNICQRTTLSKDTLRTLGRGRLRCHVSSSAQIRAPNWAEVPSNQIWKITWKKRPSCQGDGFVVKSVCWEKIIKHSLRVLKCSKSIIV